ncbi:MAG: type VII toxin-antitoxin system HepT family RNase toxin [Bacillota bacterium]
MEKLKRKLEPELKENIVDFLKREANVKLAYIFGSYGTKYQNTYSDLDLAVLFDDPPEMLEQMELAARLELKLGKYDIDLINLNNVKLAFKYEVVRSGELIYSRDEIETAEFKEGVLKFGPDAEEIKYKFQQEYITAIKEKTSEINYNRIAEKIKFIKDNLRKLKELAELEKKDFLSDYRNFDSAKYNLQAAVEAMLDIAAHIISREGYTSPKTSADSFRILADEGIIQENLLLKFVKMTKFRNRIVHLYDQIDEEYVYQIINNNLEDIESYVDLIVNRYF